MRIRTAIIMTLTALLATSCCPCRKGKSSNTSLSGTTWKAITINHNGSSATIADDAEGYTLIIENGRINGQGDCNSYFGSFSEKDGKIAVSGMGSTKAMCHDQEREDKFLQTIATANGYSIEGDRLMLLRDGRVTAIFKALK
ncbi:MAG: META domain-containing protein [Rikenellaceae bacterium]|nr:META domain-containing protein [Rikenellaceae bacterium]